MTPIPRVIVPGTVAKGEVVPVKTIIQHEMETGLRTDSEGEERGLIDLPGSQHLLRSTLDIGSESVICSAGNPGVFQQNRPKAVNVEARCHPSPTAEPSRQPTR
jgi:hypothetical protein